MLSITSYFLALFSVTLLCFAHPSLQTSSAPKHIASRMERAAQDSDVQEAGFIDSSLPGHPWMPPAMIKGASRSPCPLLNTLANHGFLTRDGRNINVNSFNQAMIDSLNFSPELANQITTGMLGKLGSPLSIDLETLNNYTTKNDHDASFSRLDKIESPDSSPAGTPIGTLIPNKRLIEMALADSVPREFAFLNTTSMARTRLRREVESVAAGSPPLSDALKSGGIREAALALQFIGEGGDPNEIGGGEEVWDQRLASKDRMREWLIFERFPRGWRRTTHAVTDAGDIVPLSNRVKFWTAQAL